MVLLVSRFVVVAVVLLGGFSVDRVLVLLVLDLLLARVIDLLLLARVIDLLLLARVLDVVASRMILSASRLLDTLGLALLDGELGDVGVTIIVLS